MRRRLVLLVAALAAVAACYVVVLRVAPVRDLSHLAKLGPETAPPVDTREYEEVAVEIEIPPLSEFPESWAQMDGCPHVRMSRALGAQISGGGGVRVLGVQPEGPAAKAGIQPGDVFGEPEDCASGLAHFFRPHTKARTVEWTVRRPKGGAGEPDDSQRFLVPDGRDMRGMREEGDAVPRGRRGAGRPR
jgi:hypothetical protein